MARSFPTSHTVRFLSALAVTVTLVGPAACGGPRPVRGEEVEGFDDEAMSTGLDRRDLQKMMHENMKAMQSAAVIKRWQSEDSPALAVLPLRNETSEHVDSALQALMSDIETKLINAGHVRVISHENQAELIEEIRKQHSSAYNQADISRWGQQIGAKYFITGKVFSADERNEDERRVQYFLFLQVIEIATGSIVFQNKTSVTKGIAYD